MTSQKPSFQAPEIIYIAGDQVACDGGEGAIGHPRVYLTVDKRSHTVDCGYCDRRYIQDPEKAPHPVGGKPSAAH